MIGDTASHGWRLFLQPGCASLTQSLVGAAEIVGRANQVHTCFQRMHSLCRMPTFAGQGSKPLAHRSIEPFNECGVEDCSSPGGLQELASVFERPQRHLAGNCDDAFFLRSLDNGSDTQPCPDP